MDTHFHGPVGQVAGGNIVNGPKDDIANLDANALRVLVENERRAYRALKRTRLASPATVGLLVGHAATIAAFVITFPSILKGQLSAFALLACLLPALASVTWFRLHLRRVDAKLALSAMRIEIFERELARRY